MERVSWKWGLILVILAVGITLIVSRARADEHDWVVVARDANYTVEIDRSRTSPARIANLGKWLPVVDTWYRTNHDAPRLYREKPFNREIVHSVLRCDSLWFLVLSVDMSMNDGRSIAHQVTPVDEARRQGWRRIELGTTEEIAARAACHFGAASGTGNARGGL